MRSINAAERLLRVNRRAHLRPQRSSSRKSAFKLRTSDHWRDLNAPEECAAQRGYGLLRLSAISFRGNLFSLPPFLVVLKAELERRFGLVAFRPAMRQLELAPKNT